MIHNPPLMIQARNDHNADDMRDGATLLAAHADSSRPRGGLIPGTGEFFAVSIAGWGFTVDKGAYLMPAPSNGVGGWPIVNDETGEPLTVAPSNPTQGRVDRVIARVHDAQYHGNSGVPANDNKAEIRVIPGVVGSAAPAVVPASMGEWVELWQINVPAGSGGLDVANFTRPTPLKFTAAAGGSLRLRTVAERDALNAASWPGMQVYVDENNATYQRSFPGGPTAVWNHVLKHDANGDVNVSRDVIAARDVIVGNNLLGPWAANVIAGLGAGGLRITDGNGLIYGNFNSCPDGTWIGNGNLFDTYGTVVSVKAGGAGFQLYVGWTGALGVRTWNAASDGTWNGWRQL
jgi:hypothetical protein